MQPNLQAKKTWITLAIVAALALAGIIIFATGRSQPAKPVPSQQTTPAETTYSGTDALLNAGATNSTVEGFKFAMHRFLTAHPPIGREVIISGVDHGHDRDTGNDTYTFKLQLQDKNYDAVLTSSINNTVQLTLKLGGSPVFTSDPIDLNSQNSN